MNGYGQWPRPDHSHSIVSWYLTILFLLVLMDCTILNTMNNTIEKSPVEVLGMHDVKISSSRVTS